MNSVTSTKIRVALLRHHRDKAIRLARWARDSMKRAEADGQTAFAFSERLRLVRLVTRARCNNHSILMWRRLYGPSGALK